MQYAIIYSSRTGNTKMLAEAIRSALPQNDCIYFGPPDSDALSAQKIYIGFWTDKGSCSEDLQDFIRQLTHQDVFLFGTAGFGIRSEYYDTILQNVRQLLPKTINVIGSFMCQGKMPQSIRDRYVKMAQSPNPQPNLDLLIANFDQASTHPDHHDLENLKQNLLALSV